MSGANSRTTITTLNSVKVSGIPALAWWMRSTISRCEFLPEGVANGCIIPRQIRNDCFETIDEVLY